MSDQRPRPRARKSGCTEDIGNGAVYRCYSPGRHYGYPTPDNDPGRAFSPRNDPSTLCAWVKTILGLVVLGAGATCVWYLTT